MVHDYKAALDRIELCRYAVGDDCYIDIGDECHYETIRHALQLAQEAEQLRKERDELALALLALHRAATDCTGTQSIDHVLDDDAMDNAVILAKKVSENANKNAS